MNDLQQLLTELTQVFGMKLRRASNGVEEPGVVEVEYRATGY